MSAVRPRAPRDSDVTVELEITRDGEVDLPTPSAAIGAPTCVAMAKDPRSTCPIIADRGCPADPALFPRFTPEGNALLSVYEAFRFTESYGVIFQCNVKYCLGPCQPVSYVYGVNLEGTEDMTSFFIA